MQLFQINQSEDISKITIMFDNPSGQFHQRSIKKRSIATAPTLLLNVFILFKVMQLSLEISELN